MAQLIDGKLVSQSVKDRIRDEVAVLKENGKETIPRPASMSITKRRRVNMSDSVRSNMPCPLKPRRKS